MRKKPLCAGVWVFDRPLRIVVAGAGAIGCYVGGLLASAGRDVTFLGRARLQSELAETGLTLTDFSGGTSHLEAPAFSTDPTCLQGADIVLVAVKSAGTADIAKDIQTHAPKAQVVSLQNGIFNADHLREALPDANVRAAVVGFNVVQTAPGVFHQGTSGGIIVEAGTGHLGTVLSAKSLDVTESTDIRSVQWGKLLVNLNNALNALSGLTLLEQLHDPGWRRLLAAQMRETLNVLRKAGITPARFSPVAPGLVPLILRLPTPLFTRIAKAMLTVDPQARSSMQDDLTARRMTEIDALQGAVLQLAASQGQTCPIIETVVAAIRAAETAESGSPRLRPDQLLD